MAEPAGLALGALSVAALFNNALDWFHHVRIAKDFGRDFETYQCKLDLLELRLSQWGEATGINIIEQDSDLAYSAVETQKARNVLEQIIRLFEEAEKKTRGLSRRVSESDFSACMKDICGKMRGLSVGRMNRTHMAKKDIFTKTKWALFTRDEFTQLVSSISDLVNDLIAAFPVERVVRKVEELCEADAVQLVKTDGDVGVVLKEVLGKEDQMMRDALEKVGSRGSHYNTVNFSGDGNKGQQIGQNYGSMTNSWGG